MDECGKLVGTRLTVENLQGPPWASPEDWPSRLLASSRTADAWTSTVTMGALGASPSDARGSARWPFSPWSLDRPCLRTRRVVHGCATGRGYLPLSRGRSMPPRGSGTPVAPANTRAAANLLISENAGTGERLDTLCGHFARARATGSPAARLPAAPPRGGEWLNWRYPRHYPEPRKRRPASSRLCAMRRYPMAWAVGPCWMRSPRHCPR